MMFILQIRKLKLRLINLQICTEITVGIELEIGFVLLPERDHAGLPWYSLECVGLDSMQERFHDMGSGDFESTFMRQ